ncbi:MAG: hypothetical protein WBB01_14680 [Phormidesmis sp.]
MPFLDRLSLATCILGLGFSYSLTSQRAIAQTTLPTCPAPASQEYLLLVRGNTEADRARIASVLPADNTVLICDYLSEVLVRAGGFTSLETANAWASYMTTVEGFESFVARPAAEELATEPEQPVAEESIAEPEQPVAEPEQPVAEEPVAEPEQPVAEPEQPVAEEPIVEPEQPVAELEQPVVEEPVTGPPAAAEPVAENSGDEVYQPQRLAAGYAVLVDFGDRPEIASTVGQIITPVGLAVYQQRPYLLADYTQDAAVAETTLQRLSAAQLTAVVVDAEQVVQMSIDVVR